MSACGARSIRPAPASRSASASSWARSRPTATWTRPCRRAQLLPLQRGGGMPPLPDRGAKLGRARGHRRRHGRGRPSLRQGRRRARDPHAGDAGDGKEGVRGCYSRWRDRASDESTQAPWRARPRRRTRAQPRPSRPATPARSDKVDSTWPLRLTSPGTIVAHRTDKSAFFIAPSSKNG